MADVRTRFSPSPTGKLHVGGLRTALYNYLYARRHGGKFFLRIEDTDLARRVEGAVESIVEILRWAGLGYDGEPVVQSERLALYRQYADQLLKQGNAYRCACTPQRLATLRQDQEAKRLPIRYDGRCRPRIGQTTAQPGETAAAPSVVRFAMPLHGTLTCDDIIRGKITFNLATLDDQVLLKSDGFPTYHLASVVDDHAMSITHVIRGEEWLPSMPKHLLLYQALGWSPPAFAHLPLILNRDRSKLSKRSGDVAVEDYRDAGYLPAALLNFVALLGWNPGTDQEIFSLPELIERFSLERVNKSGAVFNLEKLDWINGWYLRHLSLDRLTELAAPYLNDAGLLEAKRDPAYLRQVLAVEQNRLKRLGDLPKLVDYFFREPKVDPALLPWRGQNRDDAAQVLEQLGQFLCRLQPEEFSAPTLEGKLKAFIATQGKPTGQVLWPLRVALTGRRASPGPFEIAAILGQDKTSERLRRASAALAGEQHADDG